MIYCRQTNHWLCSRALLLHKSLTRSRQCVRITTACAVRPRSHHDRPAARSALLLIRRPAARSHAFDTPASTHQPGSHSTAHFFKGERPPSARARRKARKQQATTHTITTGGRRATTYRLLFAAARARHAQRLQPQQTCSGTTFIWRGGRTTSIPFLLVLSSS